ncbi:putative bifunctional diguanylate cyclase/phosphodiesterase [Ruminococcus gauvreauii]|nr:GGDEF domain-containing phosphodiesterase [Ruminococcus gauvreauii]
MGERMMIGYAALCDCHGRVERVIRNTALWPAMEGQNIRDFFPDTAKMDELFAKDLSHGASVRLRGSGDEKRDIFLTAVSLDNNMLVLIYDIRSFTQLPQLVELVLSAAHVPEVIGQEPYGAGYYEIQKLNSQLINYQRTLAKSNVRLQNLLDEVREAKYTIEALEQDTLTGLLTEKAFYSRAQAVLEQHAGDKFYIIAVDIEQFKIVNDVFGTKTGDRLLMDLGICLLGFKTDDLALITRARADTYFALLPCSDSILQLLDQNIGNFMESYPLPMRLQAKIGIYQVDNKELSIARMCDRALMAAESVKGNYNLECTMFNDTMHEKMMLEQKIINTMVESLNSGDFYVYLQPKVEVGTGRLTGAEALVRWMHPEFGFITPADFIPVFEKNGFIYSLDLYVWRKCCEMLRNWKDMGLQVFPLSVNVSRTDFYHENLPEILSGLIGEFDLDPEELHLEITETACARDSEQLLRVIKCLKQKGFIIEMDDFGSGYSSLNTLSELPIDVMKLDLKFLNQAEHDLRQQKVMEFVINLADSLRLQVIAEGVETEAQAAFLKKMGCRHAQGYLYGRPMPEGEFVHHLCEKSVDSFREPDS